MKLRRKSSVFPGGRRQRQADGGTPQSSPGFAYRSRRSDQELNLGRQISRETADTAPKNLGRFLLRRFGLVVLLIALVISSVNVLSLSSNARILSLTDSGGNSFLHDKAVYQAAANQLFAGSIWNRNKITVNTARINQEMLKQFPELSSVSVTLPLLSKRPVVYIQTAQPALILATQDGSYIIDTSGKALLRAGSLPAGSQLTLPLVTDQSGLKVSINRQALSSDNVSFIQTVVAQLAARHFSVASAVLPVGTSELDVHLDGQPYTVKFNLQSGAGDARQQAGTFLATQAKLQSQNITPSQYIDVRVDGRAYYK
jgi:hypothetical protein